MNGKQPVLVVGASGLLGTALVAELLRRGRACQTPDRRTLDLMAAEPPLALLETLAPAAVINAAAYTDVAQAEDPAQREQVYGLNRDAPERLATACSGIGVPLIHVSTDYVFDGNKGAPYVEDDPTCPLQEYGRSKLSGEEAVLDVLPEALVVRVSTLFGPARRRRSHYVDAVLQQALRRTTLDVVRLPVSSPGYTPDLAFGIVELLDAGATGIVHLANSGHCSRLELSRELVLRLGLAETVTVHERPEATGSLARPANSALDTGRYTEVTGKTTRSWQEALGDYLDSHVQ